MILYAPFAAKAPSLNGSSSPKDYPFAKQLAALLSKDNFVIQVGGSSDEQLTKDFRKNLPFDKVSELIEECDTAVCVDSYLQHHCWFLDKRAIVLWGISDPQIFGHEMHLNLLKDRKYLRANQFDLYYSNQHNPDAFVKPGEVMENLDAYHKNME